MAPATIGERHQEAVFCNRRGISAAIQIADP
jgi:hypothetical protein